MNYRSKFEQRFHAYNRDLLYEPTRLPYTIVHHYTPDFYDPSTDTYYETKGLWLAKDRTKLLEVMRQHPDLKIVMVFMNPNLKLSKTSKTTYAQWCDKKGVWWMRVGCR